MSGAFDITIATNTVVLDERREGSAAFTVSNTTGHAVRVRGSVFVIEPTDVRWLRLVGNSEREFPVGGADQFAVEVAVPKEVAGGLYTFRLDVVSVPLPDEEWAHGPIVAFEVPAVQVPPVIPPPVPVEAPGYVETVVGAIVGEALLGGIPVALGILTQQLILLIPAAIGVWLGPVAGTGVALKVRGFRDLWITAFAEVILLPILGIPIVLGNFALLNAIGVQDGLGAILFIIGDVAAVVIPALAARAFGRWRSTGHL